MEPKIVHYPKENERAIKMDRGEEAWWLGLKDWKRMWTYKEQWAYRFFHEDSAVSALVIVKHKKWELKEEKPFRPEQPKQSWGEFSSD